MNGQPMKVWARVAIVSGLIGLIVANTFLPGALQGLLLALFLLAGPGSAVCAWIALPRSVAALIVPTTGLAVVVLYATFAVQVGGWAPMFSLVVASILTFAAGMSRTIVEARQAATPEPSRPIAHRSAVES